MAIAYGTTPALAVEIAVRLPAPNVVTLPAF